MIMMILKKSNFWFCPKFFGSSGDEMMIVQVNLRVIHNQHYILGQFRRNRIVVGTPILKKFFTKKNLSQKKFDTTKIFHNKNLSQQKFDTTKICHKIFSQQFVTTKICHNKNLSQQKFVAKNSPTNTPQNTPKNSFKKF